MSPAKTGLAVLTRNISDFDLPMRLAPYRTEAARHLKEPALTLVVAAAVRHNHTGYRAAGKWKVEQRKVLNDALIFMSAAKAGLTVLTRNISDFDLLMQLAPYGKVLFYDI